MLWYGPGCLCLPQHLHLFIYARLQYIGETLRAVALLDNLSFFCIHPRHMSACLPAAYGVFGTGCHGCRNFSVFVLCWSEFLKVCVRDGSICDCIVTTTIVHKSRNLWQTRLCIRRSHALTFLLHSNTSIIVASSQVNSLTQLNYLIQSDTDSEQRNCGDIKSRPCARQPLHWKVTWKVSLFGFRMKIMFSNNFHVNVQASATS